MTSLGARRTRLMVGGIVAVTTLAAIVVDYSLTTTQVPDLPSLCAVADDAACNETRNAAIGDRLTKALSLEDGFRSRMWLYAGLLSAVALGLGAIGVVGSTREGRRQTFTDLGIAGVLWLLTGVAVLSATGGGLVDLPAKPLFAPFWSMCVIGAIGSLVVYVTEGARSRGKERDLAVPGGESVVASSLRRTVEARSWVVGGLVMTALSVAAAFGSSSGRGTCGVDDPRWTDVTLGAASVVAVFAALTGLVCLAKRRWIVALICITVGPFACATAVLVAACLN